MGLQQPYARYDGCADGRKIIGGAAEHVVDPAARRLAAVQINMSTAWLYLFVAGCFEVVWALGIKYTEGFSKPVASVITVAAMVASVWLLALALKSIPVGTGYAVWVGIGAVGAAIGGVILFGESKSWPRIFCILLIVSGVIGLKLFSEPDV